jgi:hypothetical protein
VIDSSALVEVEADVQRALDTGDSSSLCVLGRGEISLVLGHPADEPRWACKRLPPFPSAGAADRYEHLLARYLDELRRRGVDVLDTEVRRVPGAGSADVLYCVQAALPASSLAVGLVRSGDDRTPALLAEIVETAVEVVDDRVGLDAQLSNWALLDERSIYFDVTTPLLRTEDGTAELDADVFLASLPWPMRSPVRRFVLPGIIDRYHRPRVVVLDLAANLVKERVDHWIPTVLDAASGRVDPPITEDEVRRDYRSDARTWRAIQALRRADRSWQRHLRRRTYPFLLPGRLDR